MPVKLTDERVERVKAALTWPRENGVGDTRNSSHSKTKGLGTGRENVGKEDEWDSGQVRRGEHRRRGRATHLIASERRTYGLMCLP